MTKPDAQALRELGVLALKLASNKKTRKLLIDAARKLSSTRQLIVGMFGSQMAAARRLRVNERTVRWWCQHDAPPHVLDVLYRLARREISLRWARQLIRTKRTRRFNGRRRRA